MPQAAVWAFKAAPQLLLTRQNLEIDLRLWAVGETAGKEESLRGIHNGTAVSPMAACQVRTAMPICGVSLPPFFRVFRSPLRSDVVEIACLVTPKNRGQYTRESAAHALTGACGAILVVVKMRVDEGLGSELRT